MDDLISRQAAIDAIDKIFPADPMRNEYTQGITCGAALATEYIKQLPPAQERKKGRWELAEDGWYCSSCELYPPFDCDPEEKGIPYCPNCGAEMRGEER